MNDTVVSFPSKPKKLKPGRYVYSGVEKNGIRKNPSGAIYQRQPNKSLKRIN